MTKVKQGASRPPKPPKELPRPKVGGVGAKGKAGVAPESKEQAATRLKAFKSAANKAAWQSLLSKFGIKPKIAPEHTWPSYTGRG